MLYESERGNFSLMLLGDVMPTRRLAVFGEKRYLQLRESFGGPHGWTLSPRRRAD